MAKGKPTVVAMAVSVAFFPFCTIELCTKYFLASNSYSISCIITTISLSVGANFHLLSSIHCTIAALLLYSAGIRVSLEKPMYSN